MNKLNIIDELGKLGIEVTQKGSRTFCCCPFHNEKTPSCSINEQTNTYYCFGCGEKGNVYDLVSKITGKPLDVVKGKVKKLPEEINVNNFVSTFYSFNLNKSATGEKVLKDFKYRGLTKDVIEYFGIGLSPKDDVLYKLLGDIAKEGNEENRISIMSWTYSPLITKPAKKDFFKERLMFPIRNIEGDVIGFTARSLKKDENIKYLNTSDTSYFKKKSILYNIQNAISEIRRKKQVYIVEGPFDVISYHLCGIKNVVSPLTCNISREQLELITSSCGKDVEFVLAFDNDKAGVRGVKNAQELFKSESIWNYKIVNYSYKDGGEYVEHDKLDELKEILDKPLDVADYMAMFYNKSKNQDTKSRIINSFVSMVYTFPNFILKEQISKFEKNINDTDSFVTELIFKRKNEGDLLKLIGYQLKTDNFKFEVFNLLVNPKILTEVESKVLGDLKHYNFKGYENSYKFSNLVISFLKKRVKSLTSKENV